MNTKNEDGDILCPDCSKPLTPSVDRREVHVDRHDLEAVETYCRTCSVMAAFHCTLSDEWWAHSDFTRARLEDTGERFCEEAANEGYGNMPTVYYYNDAYHSEEESDDYADGEDVENYHEGRRPWEHQHSDGTAKVGIELEVECGDGSTRRDLARDIHATCSGFLCETDGSLSYSGGMEIIAPPVPPDRVAEQWNPVLRILASAHCPNHTGQHVNQDREWIGDDGFKGIASVVHRYHRWFKRFTGRDSMYGSYHPGYRWGSPIGGRVAVHASMAGRVEWRIFQGTISPVRFFANVELTLCVKEYVDATDPEFFRTTDTVHLTRHWRKGLASLLRAGKYPLLRDQLMAAGMVRPSPKTGQLWVPALQNS